MILKPAEQVLIAYQHILDIDISQCGEIGRSIPIPTFDADLITKLCEQAKEQLVETPIVMHVQAPIYVIGDIHGNIFDLIRILVHALPPPRSRLLFLGDYVDRGEYSVEVVTLLFALMCKYPNYVYVLRGNHEFYSMNTSYGFLDEVKNQYKSKALFEVFNDTFQYLPLVAIINNEIFCVHGGISPSLTSLSQIEKIKRPLSEYDVEYVCDFVWSDPSYDTQGYNISSRGLGVQFGVKALTDFLNNLNMTKIIRAHQCVQPGVTKFGGDLLHTVFSCSNYADSLGNRCGLIFVKPTLQLQLFSLPPLEQIPRSEANTKRCQPVEEQEMMANNALSLNVKLFELQSKRNTKTKLHVPRPSEPVNKLSKSDKMFSVQRTNTPSPPPKTKLPPLNRSKSCEMKMKA
ncbi:Ser/Thr protein phosphatase [Histomonas meleagridis]|uniref:Ser/Thr protein phosphatase n=1 Tax=Histomonas meleagridis TaxID=135588 RepID=UPI0035599871|nr:Ser/Thr protein phosphatase [Histomonas meleagridis]KAH0803047.1 Ser/Thr protein phosphatase [Histomonas meleagridis]